MKFTLLIVFSFVVNAATHALDDYADLVERLMPAVVNISTKTEIKTAAPGSPQGNPFAGTPFEDFFNGFNFQFDQNGGPRRPEPARATACPPQQSTCG